jgi:hypothetical protein
LTSLLGAIWLKRGTHPFHQQMGYVDIIASFEKNGFGVVTRAQLG